MGAVGAQICEYWELTELKTEIFSLRTHKISKIDLNLTGSCELGSLAYLGAYGAHMFALRVWVGFGAMIQKMFFKCSNQTRTGGVDIVCKYMTER